MYFRVSLLLSREPPRSRADDDHRFPAFRESRPAANRHSSRLPQTSQVASLRVSVDVFSCGREAASASRVAPARRADRRRRRRGGGFRRRVRAHLAVAAARPTPRDASADRPRVEGRTRGSARGRADVMSAEDASRATGAAGRGEAAPAGGGVRARGGRLRIGAFSVSGSVSVSRVPTATPNQPAASVFARVGGAGPNGVARSDIGIPSQELAALARAKGLRAESTFVSEGTFFCFRRARLTSSSPENHGIRVKRLRQNDPSRAFHRKPRVVHVRRRVVS